MHMYPHANAPRRRRFAVTVDGVRHEVIVEELDVAEQSPAPGPTSWATSDSSSPAATPSAATNATATAPGDNGLVDGWLEAPMPGTVTDVAVKVGDKVQAGDVVLVLTAMKLENEITSPAAGTVATVAVSQGDSVNNGDRLIRLDVEGSA